MDGPFSFFIETHNWVADKLEIDLLDFITGGTAVQFKFNLEILGYFKRATKEIISTHCTTARCGVIHSSLLWLPKTV